jgi:hypothetical protein
MGLQAHNRQTLQPVAVGDPVTTFRSEPGVLVRCDQATAGGRDGKVTVRLDDAKQDDYWYASVVDLYVVDLESLAFCEAGDAHDWYDLVVGKACWSCGKREALTVA